MDQPRGAAGYGRLVGEIRGEEIGSSDGYTCWETGEEIQNSAG